MNILPKKRWHVRTKENIARVRKDEAEAAEKERQENLRIENADREARLSVLKTKSKHKLLEAGGVSEPEPTTVEPAREHVNLFADYDNANKNTNKDHDIEVKEKKEDYEKKIGYLTYLGQDTNESLKKKNWYEVAPETSRFARTDAIKETYNKLVLKDEDGKPKSSTLDIKNGEVGWKSKQKLDPINAFRKHCFETKKPESLKEKSKKDTTFSKNNKTKSKTDDKKEKLLKLREARLKREREEKLKTERFLTKLNGTTNDTPASSSKEQETTRVKPKYNSQFNPELARQNFR